MISLAADIGGTFSRLAWGGIDGGRAEQSFDNSEFDSLEAVIDHGRQLAGVAGEAIDDMVLALPGPVQDDPIRLTNIAWQLQRSALQARFRTSRLQLVNDFQAAALGALGQPQQHLRTLNAAATDDGPVVVAGAGTGLGMAWLATRDLTQLPRATEGGHLDFAPNAPGQLALYHCLAGHYGHVSYERVLSGGGLVDAYRCRAGDPAAATTPAAIAAAARRGERTAIDTIEQFVAVFAAYAGNLALAFNPTGGIYLCGGLSTHLAEWFEPGAFSTAYTAKGRMAEMVRRIPVFLVARHDTGLAGAERILQGLQRAET